MSALAHPDEDKFFSVALELVKTAGRLVRDAFEQPASRVQTKSSNTDLVTETDQAVERLLIDGLSKAFPDHKFIGEESVAGGAKIEWTDAPTWIIDPIDGTTNFVHRIPLIGICVGLSIGRQLRAGIVYNPISNELFTAQVGRGAFRNGFPIHVSTTKQVSQSLLCSSLGIHNIAAIGEGWLDIVQANQRALVKQGVRGFRSLGSAALAVVYVAQGITDGYVEYGIHSWDVAAAAVILAEAGGVLRDPNGGAFNVMARKILCASTDELATAISGSLTHAEYSPEA